jgi:hypothetical protein
MISAKALAWWAARVISTVWPASGKSAARFSGKSADDWEGEAGSVGSDMIGSIEALRLSFEAVSKT